MAGLSAQDIIRITSSIAPAGLARRETGRTLLLSTDTSLGILPETRVKTYTNFAGVKDDFAEGTEPYEAGRIYFSQEPLPKNLLIGQMRPATSGNTPSTIVGEVLTETEQLLLGSISSASISVGIYATIDGLYISNLILSTDGMDWTGLDVAQIGALVDQELNVRLNANGMRTADGGFYWNDIESRFKCAIEPIVEKEGDVCHSAVFITSLPNSKADDLKLTSGEGAEYVNGTAGSAETVAQALDAIKAEDPSFTFVCEDRTLSDTDAIAGIGAWCAVEKVYIQTCASHDTGVLVKDQATEFAKLSALENGNSFGTFSKIEDYKHVSIAGRMSSVNFSASNSLITAMFKILPQTLTDNDFSTTDVQNMLEQRCNFYAKRSGVSMYENGHTFSPNYWLDTKYWLIWFENAVLSSVFNLLYTSGKVEQTEVGMAMITGVIEGVCEEGVRNGGIAGGKLSPALTADVQQTTGNSSFDGVLANGYFVYSEPIAGQTQNDRNQRKATPIKVWLKGSGAIQSVEVAILFEQ